jgi:6-hydroxytryprostatin B O-methyltransferase
MIDHFRLYSFVPVSGVISYAEISKASGLPVDVLQRVFSQAMLNNIFYEPRPDFVAHSSISLLLVKDSSLAAWLGHNYNEVFASMHALPEALTKFPGSSDPGETALGIAFKQPKGLFAGLFGELSGSKRRCKL